MSVLKHRNETGEWEPIGMPLADMNGTSLLTRGSAITSGEDLNNYTTLGVYYVQNSIVASGITNSPLTNRGYKLIVEESYLGNAYPMQKIYSNDGLTYIRCMASSGSWGKWHKYTVAEVT